jgi:2-polyprenyl-3-methyl-5-hydroxy-6-metoxy-1,4-benzoquinol methylase
MESEQVKFKESYVGLRTDLLSLVEPESTGLCVLDVGCSTGVNGQFLLDSGVADKMYGIEFDPAMAEVAERHYVTVLKGDIEEMTLPRDWLHLRFDYILFGDILEHLKMPSTVLSRFIPLLSANGKIIVSVPNMQHISALWQLGVVGYWPRNERGIFDRTHLQVFTLKNLTEMIRQVGLTVELTHRVFRYRDRIGSRFPIYGKILKVLFPNYYTFQYIVRAGRGG